MWKVLFLTALVFSSCAGSAVGTPAVSEGADGPAVLTDWGRLVSGPGEGTLTVIGISGRMRSAEREIDSALDDAARQISLYHGLKGKATTIVETGAGYCDFYLAVEAEFTPLDEGGYAAYREALRFDREKDLIRTDKAVFVRCVYDAPGLSPIEYGRRIENGEPAWLHGVEIPGYISAAGFSKNRRHLKETITRSRESAAAALLAGTSSRIETGAADRVNRGAAVSVTETIEGELFNFIVLEIWIDPAAGSVWTLAAAKKR